MTFSWKNYCCLFCCPPCKENTTKKLTFLIPETPTYDIQQLGDGKTSRKEYRLNINLEQTNFYHNSQEMLNSVEVFKARTDRRNEISCIFIHPNCSPNPEFTLVFSHGNGMDIGYQIGHLHYLALKLGCSILSYDYSGYGTSSGTPSEKNLYSDIRAAVSELKLRYGVQPHSLILYGQSFGCVPTIDFASKNSSEIAGVILDTPFLSGMSIVYGPDYITDGWKCLDGIKNYAKVSKILCPTLVIHDKHDEIIEFSHGQKIYELCPGTDNVEPLWVQNLGANLQVLNLELIPRLKKFIEEDLGAVI